MRWRWHTESVGLAMRCTFGFYCHTFRLSPSNPNFFARVRSLVDGAEEWQ